MISPANKICPSLDFSAHSTRYERPVATAYPVKLNVFVKPETSSNTLLLVSRSQETGPLQRKVYSDDLSEEETRKALGGDGAQSGARYGAGFLLGALCVSFLKMTRGNETAAWPPATSDNLVVEENETIAVAPAAPPPANASRLSGPRGGAAPLVYDYAVVGAGAAGLLAEGLGVSLGARTVVVEAGEDDGIG